MARLITLQLIESDEKLAGNGKDDPYRRIKQWFTTDGTLVLQYDHAKDETSMVGNLINHLNKETQ